MSEPVVTVEGTITLTSGQTTRFTMSADGTYMHWGNTRRVLSSAAPVLQAMSAGVADMWDEGDE